MHSKPCPMDCGTGDPFQQPICTGTIGDALPSPRAVVSRDATMRLANSIDSLVRVSRRAETGTGGMNFGQALPLSSHVVPAGGQRMPSGHPSEGCSHQTPRHDPGNRKRWNHGGPMRPKTHRGSSMGSLHVALGPDMGCDVT